MIFSNGKPAREGKLCVEIPDSVISEMRAIALRHTPLEIAGCLYGHYSDDHWTAYIDGLAPIAPDTKQEHYGCSIGVEGLNEWFDDLWNKTKQLYIGDWHSHPNNSPEPSEIDIATGREVVTDESRNCPQAVMVILGGCHFTDMTITVYDRGKPRSSLFVEK